MQILHVEIGWIQLKLVEKANEGNSAPHIGSDQGGEKKSGVGAAIDRLEENLNKQKHKKKLGKRVMPQREF